MKWINDIIAKLYAENAKDLSDEELDRVFLPCVASDMIRDLARDYRNRGLLKVQKINGEVEFTSGSSMITHYTFIHKQKRYTGYLKKRNIEWMYTLEINDKNLQGRFKGDGTYEDDIVFTLDTDKTGKERLKVYGSTKSAYHKMTSIINPHNDQFDTKPKKELTVQKEVKFKDKLSESNKKVLMAIYEAIGQEYEEHTYPKGVTYYGDVTMNQVCGNLDKLEYLGYIQRLDDGQFIGKGKRFEEIKQLVDERDRLKPKIGDEITLTYLNPSDDKPVKVIRKITGFMDASVIIDRPYTDHVTGADVEQILLRDIKSTTKGHTFRLNPEYKKK